MPKIKNKKTGEIIEVSEKELKKYGIDLPKAQSGTRVPFTKNAPQNNQYVFNQGIYPPTPYDDGVIDDEQIMSNLNQDVYFNPNALQFNSTGNPAIPFQPINYNTSIQQPQLDENTYRKPQNLVTPDGQNPQTGTFYNPQTNKQNTTTNKFNFNPDNINVNAFGNQYLAKGVGQLTSGIFNMGKGTLDLIGSYRQNKMEQQRNADQFKQSVFNNQEFSTPSQIYGSNVQGANELNLEHGGSINNFKTNSFNGNVEVEAPEVIKLPNGFSDTVVGKKHSEGGEVMNLPINSKVFSEKLKIDKKSFADLAKKFETKKNFDMLDSKYADPIQKKTAELSIKYKDNKLNELFETQEGLKMSGFFGKDIQKKAMQENEQAQYGKLIKAEEGIITGHEGRIYNPKTKKYEKSKVLGSPFNQDETFGLKGKQYWYGVLEDLKNSPDVGKLFKDVEFPKNWDKKSIDSFVGTLQSKWKNTPYQPVIEDYMSRVDKTNQKRINESSPSQGFYDNLGFFRMPNIRQATKEEFEKLNKDNPINVEGKNIYFNKFKNYGTNGNSTGLGEYVYYNEPINALQVPPQAPPQDVSDTPSTFKANQLPTKFKNNDPDLNLNLNIPVPDINSRFPLNYYKINPEFIDPRYLDIRPELNQITRGQRTFQNNLGSRSASDMSNLLQSQVNAYNQKSNVFGKKYNYDKQQDSQAQQFNAQAVMNTNQYNQGSWYNQLESGIRDRESAIGTYELAKREADKRNAMLENSHINTKNFYDDIYSGGINSLTPEEYTALVFGDSYDPNIKIKKDKYGGKITKIKPKIKKK